MVGPGRLALAGLVEVDETEIPCRSKNDPLSGGGGRSHPGKLLIVGAVEIEDGGAGPGRIRLGDVPDYSTASLHPFIADNLAPGATAKTDRWSAYPGAIPARPASNTILDPLGDRSRHLSADSMSSTSRCFGRSWSVKARPRSDVTVAHDTGSISTE